MKERERCISGGTGASAKTHRSENGQQGLLTGGAVERCWGPRQEERSGRQTLQGVGMWVCWEQKDATISGRGAKGYVVVITLPGSEDGLDR